MKATLRKMGMDFGKDYKGASDVGNYRVRAEFMDRNGLELIVDFGGYERKEIYKKKNGKTSYRVVNKNALHIDGGYYDSDGFCWDYAYRLRENGFDFTKYDFTISGILSFLSDVTGHEFTEIEFV